MKYENIEKGTFLERPNRFIAKVQIDGQVETCHVKNTGRCRELLHPGAKLYLQYCDREKRKTKYDVIAVEKNGQIINMDSQIPNRVVEEWLKKSRFFSGTAHIKPEQKYKNSRFDFYIEDGDTKAFMEVKGVTLEEDHTARFPDAPTERGVKHIMELCDCVKNGYDAYLFFVIQMKQIHVLEPNWDTHEAFGLALQKAQKAGVHIMAYDCVVTEDSIVIDHKIPVDLKRRKK